MYMTKIWLILNCLKVDWKNIIKTIKNVNGNCGFQYQCMLSAIIIIVKKKVGSARLRESDIHPISLKTSAPQYQPIDRKKGNGKRAEGNSRDRAAYAIKRHWPCSSNPPVPHHRLLG